MNTRRPMVAGNWKMYGSAAANAALVDGLRQGLAGLGAAAGAVDTLVCPPFVYLAAVAGRLAGSGVTLGAQNLCAETGQGAYTGEVAGEMLREVGCSHVIVGHSERRALYAESDEIIARKYAAALATGLTPILCVGETLAERDGDQTSAVVARQLDALIAHCGVAALGRGLVAYEPVWAIGTGKVATTAQAQEVHAFIRGLLVKLFGEPVAQRIRILYGGSMKPANAPELLAQSDIDGGLIGGASLESRSFVELVNAALAAK